MDYTEPTMKFNIALNKFEPDLLQKPQKGSKPLSDRQITIIVLAVIIFLILLFLFFQKIGRIV